MERLNLLNEALKKTEELLLIVKILEEKTLLNPAPQEKETIKLTIKKTEDITDRLQDLEMFAVTVPLDTRLFDLIEVIALSNRLNVSVDYLLGKTQNPKTAE